jgi:hypothetical protein
VLALRGYLQFVQGAKTLKDEEKMERINQAMPYLQRPEEKRLAISALHSIATGEALELLMKMTKDPSIAEDACSAILEATKKKNTHLSSETRQKALQSVIDNSSEAATRRKAEEAIKK